MFLNGKLLQVGWIDKSVVGRDSLFSVSGWEPGPNLSVWSFGAAPRASTKIALLSLIHGLGWHSRS